MWHQKNSLPCIKVFAFVAFKVTPKNIGIGSEESSWGDVRTNSSGKISYIGIDIYEKQNVLYISIWIEAEIIEINLSISNGNGSSHSYAWNKYGGSFDCQW